MSKSRTKRYQSRHQSEGNPHPRLVLTGAVTRKYADEQYPLPKLVPLETGDVRFYLHDDLAGAGRMRGDYLGLGVAGYLKLEIYDGKEWRLVKMDDFFPDRLHHFSKNERPIDTYALCAERMETFKGTKLMRTYREHYAMEDSFSE